MGKVKSKGVIIKYGDTASPSTTVPQLGDISFDNGAWDRQETTCHDTAGSTKTYETTLKEPSSIDVKVLLDPADTAHAWIIAAADSGAAKYMTFILPDGGAAQWAMQGHVTNMSVGGLTTGGFIEMSFTFASSVAHTFAA